MMFWIVAGGFLLLLVAWTIWPLMRRTQFEPSESQFAISVYRDQVDEIRRDVDAGMITEADAKAAEMEIEKRALQAAKKFDSGPLVGRRMPRAAIAVSCALAIGAGSLYVGLGSPSRPDQPLAERRSEVLTKRAAGGDVKARITLLIDRTKKEPKSFEAWWILAQSYASIGNHPDAVEAYRKALELSNDNLGVMTAYAEALVLANGNRVTKAARLAFEQVRRKRPKDPRVRYYLALGLAQQKDFEGAMAAWVDLYRESKANAPWLPLVRRDITNMARFLKIDLKSVLPDATAAELAKAGNKTATAKDVPKLKARANTLDTLLKSNPKDYKAWIELVSLRAHLGEADKAVVALATAREHYKAAPFIIGKLDETARNLGLDIVEKTAETTKGPSAAQIKASASLTDKERSDMVSGMVEGLAARLEEKPNDANGWMMLIRSYSVLKAQDKAAKALVTARGHFKNNPAVLAQLSQTAKQLGISTP